jgi:hypothetical protein
VRPVRSSTSASLQHSPSLPIDGRAKNVEPQIHLQLARGVEIDSASYCNHFQTTPSSWKIQCCRVLGWHSQPLG